MLDGRPTAAEVVIEPLGASGDPIGRPVTVQAQQNGRFTAGIASESVSLPCWIVLRIPRGPGGRPSALDYSVPPDKVVTLHRELQSNTAFTFLITQ